MGWFFVSVHSDTLRFLSSAAVHTVRSFGSLVSGLARDAACACVCRYEVTVSKARRSLVKEVALAGLASMLLGFGVLFLLLWAGVWV